MMLFSPARLALAALLAGSIVAKAHAQPAQPTQPAKPSGDDARKPGDAKESAAMAEARTLYLEGNEHYSAGRYALAAERFIKAFELSGKPALLFNLANTYERAGDYKKAAHYLRLYLDGGEVHDPAAVRARLQRLELTVIEHDRRGDDTAKPSASATPVTSDGAEVQDPPVTNRQASRVPYYVAGGGVAIGAATAVVFGLRARSDRARIDELCVDQAGGMICQPDAEDYLSGERRNALISDIGIGVAAASVATGLIYYLVTRDDSARREPSGHALSIAPSTNGDGFHVLAVGRF